MQIDFFLQVFFLSGPNGAHVTKRQDVTRGRENALNLSAKGDPVLDTQSKKQTAKLQRSYNNIFLPGNGKTVTLTVTALGSHGQHGPAVLPLSAPPVPRPVEKEKGGRQEFAEYPSMGDGDVMTQTKSRRRFAIMRKGVPSPFLDSGAIGQTGANAL